MRVLVRIHNFLATTCRPPSVKYRHFTLSDTNPFCVQYISSSTLDQIPGVTEASGGGFRKRPRRAILDGRKLSTAELARAAGAATKEGGWDKTERDVKSREAELTKKKQKEMVVLDPVVEPMVERTVEPVDEEGGQLQPEVDEGEAYPTPGDEEEQGSAESNKLGDQPCAECAKIDNEFCTLLCDGCGDAYHIYCLNPILEEVPDDEVSHVPFDYNIVFNTLRPCPH